MTRLVFCFSILVSLCLSPLAPAASKFKKSLYTKAMSKKTGRFVRDGVIVGGEISKGFTLLNVRSGKSKKNQMERVVLDLGDLRGQPIKNQVAFYHVNVDSKKSQIVIDLNQVARSGVDQAAIKKVFKKSPYVKNAEITFDPEDLTTSIVLSLKSPTMVEVFDLVSTENPSRIVLDLKKANKRKKAKTRRL